MDDIYQTYISILIEIGDDLGVVQFKRMLHLMGDKIPKILREKLEANKEFLDLYEIIKERALIRPPSENDIGESNYLIKTLTNIKREDLARKLIGKC
jgi:hypothetical protein